VHLVGFTIEEEILITKPLGLKKRNCAAEDQTVIPTIMSTAKLQERMGRK
jgi:hypothetical protein